MQTIKTGKVAIVFVKCPVSFSLLYVLRAHSSCSTYYIYFSQTKNSYQILSLLWGLCRCVCLCVFGLPLANPTHCHEIARARQRSISLKTRRRHRTWQRAEYSQSQRQRCTHDLSRYVAVFARESSAKLKLTRWEDCITLGGTYLWITNFKSSA